MTFVEAEEEDGIRSKLSSSVNSKDNIEGQEDSEDEQDERWNKKIFH